MKNIALATVLAFGVFGLGEIESVRADRPIYQDISPSYRFEPAIRYLLEEEVIAPTPYYYPDEPMTREDFAVMIAKAKGLPEAHQTVQFNDLYGRSSASWIQAAVDSGIVSGYPDGTFRPFSTVTRGELAIMLSRAYDLKGSGSSPFRDVTPNVSSYRAVLGLSEASYVGGFEDGTFRPGEPLTRGQAAAFIERTMKGEAKHHYLSGNYMVGSDLPEGTYVYVADLFESHAESSTIPKGIHWYDRNGEIVYRPSAKVGERFYFTLERGDSFSFTGGYLKKASSLRPYRNGQQETRWIEGMYHVGVDMRAGTYHVRPFEGRGTVTVYDAPHVVNEQLARYTIEHPTRIVLKPNTYVVLDGVELSE